jgi:catechol-2,3-dioxygenase
VFLSGAVIPAAQRWFDNDEEPRMPKLTRVLETALYVADLDRAAAFYGDVLGLPCIHEDHRMRAYDVGGNGVLLLFPQGGSLQALSR